MSDSRERIAALAASHDVELAYHLVMAVARGAVEHANELERAATLRGAMRALSQALEQLHGGAL